LVSAKALSRTSAWLGTVAKDAQIVTTCNSKVSPAIVLQDFDWQDDQQENQPHQLRFETLSLPMSERTNISAFVEALFQEYPGLVRAKGFAQDLGGGLKTLQIVGKRVAISAAPVGAKPGVVIIYNV